MLILKIIGIFVLIIFLISLIQIGVEISLIEQRLLVSAKLLGKKIQIYPGDSEKKQKIKESKDITEKKEDKSKPRVKKKKRIKILLSFDNIMEFIGILFRGIGKVTRGYNIDRFLLHLTVSGNDPYRTAVSFAYINAFMSILSPICVKRFNCKNSDVRTDIDFTQSLSRADFAVSAVIRIGAFFAMLNTILFGFLGIIIRNKLYLFWLKMTDKDEYEYKLEEYSFVSKIMSEPIK